MARSNRDGQRKRRDSFPKRVPDLGYYIILTDADETEKNYLNGLQRSLPKELQGRLVIRVIKTKTPAVSPKYAHAKKLKPSRCPQEGTHTRHPTVTATHLRGNFTLLPR